MRVLVISGYFNPIHSGHIDYITSASKLCDKLIVVVNSDHQVNLKGSTPFQNEEERQKIVSSIKGVDEAVISIDKDESVCQTVRSQYYRHQDDPFFLAMAFCNGGDRKRGGIPEEVLYEELGIRMLYNIGGEKVQSSSKLIKQASISQSIAGE